MNRKGKVERSSRTKELKENRKNDNIKKFENFQLSRKKVLLDCRRSLPKNFVD